MWRAKYDQVNAENEQLRLMLRLRLSESTGDSQSDLRLVHRKPSSSLPQSSMAVDANGALSSQPVVNMDVRGSNITDIGRDVHNHVHNHWITIRFVRLVIVIYKILNGMTIRSNGNTMIA